MDCVNDILEFFRTIWTQFWHSFDKIGVNLLLHEIQSVVTGNEDSEDSPLDDLSEKFKLTINNRYCPRASDAYLICLSTRQLEKGIMLNTMLTWLKFFAIRNNLQLFQLLPRISFSGINVCNWRNTLCLPVYCINYINVNQKLFC